MGARPQDLEMLQANVAMQRSVGIQTRVVTGEDLQELEPFISIEGIVAAAYEPESGYADPSSTAGSYAKRAKELGATLMLGTKVLSVAVEKGRVAGVKTDKGPLASRAVIVAAGPWSPQLIDPTGVELPVEASRHQVCVYKWPAEFLSRLVYVDFVETVYMRPETGNLTLVGSIEPEEGEDKVKDPDRFDTGVAFETISRYAEGVSHRYPGMASGQYATGYSALYDITPDWHPILDKMPGIEGLYCAAGGSGHGFKLAPAVGEMMAEFVLHGKKPGDDIDLFSFRRFAEGRLVRSKYDYSIVG
jgi:glycine/D-amino acid oxidase-like deaminating enzyme